MGSQPKASGGGAARPVTVGLVQIAQEDWSRPPHRTYRVRNGELEAKPDFAPPSGPVSFLPYAVGCLQAYAQQHARDPARYRWLEPVFQRRPTAEVVATMAEADVVGFSTYVWNLRQNLAAARDLKRLNPERVVVFGGPQAPARAEAFLREHTFIDVICHGESEAVFLDVLEASPGRDWADVPSTSHIARDGRFVTTPLAPRAKDLSRFPSPYLTGVFEPLMQAHRERRWLALWETNRGCPYSCAYCDWGSAVASKVHQFDMARLTAEMEWFAAHDIGFIYICDANFGILPRDIDIARHLVETYERHGGFVSISIQNAKNQVERTYEIQQVFARSRVATFATNIALQGVAQETLKAIKRDNIPLKKFLELQRRFRQDGLATYTDVILGLPGETYDSFADGLELIICNGQHNRLACYNCSVLVNADMADPAYRARYGLQTAPNRIVYQYDPVGTAADVADEFVDIIIATATLDAADWRRARVYAWLAELLHFDRLLQIPFVVMAEHFGVGYRRLIEAFAAADARSHPVVAEIVALLRRHAAAIQAGGTDFIASNEHLGVWWPVDQFVLVDLVARDALDAFYADAERILLGLLSADTRQAMGNAVRDALRLSRAMIKTPGCVEDLDIDCEYDVLAFHRRVLEGGDEPLARTARTYRVRRTETVWLTVSDWASEIALNGYRPANYLYPTQALTLAEAFPWLIRA